MQRSMATNRFPDRTTTSAAPLTGWTLLVGRALVLAFGAIAVLLFLARLPSRYALLQTVCTATSCPHGPMHPDTAARLSAHGLSLSAYTLYLLAVETMVTLLMVAAGALIFWRASNERMGLFMALLLMLSPIGLVPEGLDGRWQSAAVLLQFVQPLLLLTFGLLFPDGRFVPRWTGAYAVLILVIDLFYHLLPDTPLNLARYPALDVALFYTTILIGLGAQLYRYRVVSTPVQRQQTKWFVLGFLLTIVFSIPPALMRDSGITLGPLADAALYTLMQIATLALPFGLALAVLRARLWDADPLLSRALLYTALVAGLSGLYALLVWAFGLALSEGHPLIAPAATIVIALLFQPLRDRLRQGVNHLLYGERDDPYAVLTRLGQRLEIALAPDDVLPIIARTVRDSLRLPYVAIALDHNGVCTAAAAAGHPVPDALCLPLVHQGEEIGRFILGPRDPDEPFSPTDYRLLDDLARQVGVAAHGVRLHADTVRLAVDLQRARQRLVAAREEERRRLRRDLHDGLGPAIAALTLKVGTARFLMQHDRDAAQKLLSELENDLVGTLAEVRQVVYDLRPPALDDLGLVGAVRSAAERFAASHGIQRHPTIAVIAPQYMPPLPAAVEVAAYRVAHEALANVLRHAAARHCTVTFAIEQTRDAQWLVLAVEDDGCGIPAERHSGVGLNAMRERAAELGGTCAVTRRPEGGTRVLMRLPINLAAPDDVSVDDTG